MMLVTRAPRTTQGAAKAPADLSLFCRQQQPVLLGFLTLYCGDRDVAEELTQEALVRVCANWKKVKQATSPQAWAIRVGVNLAHSHYRRRSAERRAKRRIGANERACDNPDTATAMVLLEAVSQLPRRQKTALALRFYVDLPIAQVAEIMGCPEGTVKTLTHRAVAGLRTAIDLDDLGGASNAL